MNSTSRQVERNVGIVALVFLLVGCVLVLRPFVSAFLWAVVLCISTWPVQQKLSQWTGQRRTLVALILTLLITLVFFLPFFIAGISLADNVKTASVAVRQWLDAGPPEPPTWLPKLPLVGESATEAWRDLAGDSRKLIQALKEYVEPASQWALKAGLKLGGGLIELGASIFLAFFLYRGGEGLAERLKSTIGKVAGERGQRLLNLARDTVCGVVHGIVGTALVQGILAWIGFLIAGVPASALLGLLTFFLSIVPMGPPLVWIPATIWLFYNGSVGWGVFMGIWGMGVSSIDNFIKPWLISYGSKLPFLLILIGVIGGALAFGFIGVFLGPTLLAVGYRLVDEWTQLRQKSAGGAEAP